MPLNVLITGGSGLVGTALTALLLDKGYQVSHLGRSRTSKKDVKSYIWNIREGFVENDALESANIVVHLAGAGIADQRWTDSRKEIILQSRVQSTRLLYTKLAKAEGICETVVAASAIGIYGMDTGDSWLDESSAVGEGFLAEVTSQWEKEIERLNELKLRLVTLRTGIVLSENGGALPKMAKPVRMNVGAVLGSGKQYMSWIHIDDLCRMILMAIENQSLSGVYNAVAPNPQTNETFTRTLAQVLNKSIWLPPVPELALKLAMGEMAQVVTGGNRVSSRKIASSGYQFRYPELTTALQDILK